MPKALEMASMWPSPQGHTIKTVRWATYITGKNEHGPRVITYDQGHWGSLLQRARVKCRTGGSPEWGQATEAIKQSEVYHATTVYALQQAHKDSMLVVEWQTQVEERWDCQAFVEAFQAAIWACTPEGWRELLYPLQLLTGDVPLATLQGMLATAQLWAVEDRGSALASPIPRALEIPGPQVGTKC